MSRVLVDTSGYSAFMRGRAEAIAAIQEADDLYLNPIVLGELEAGFIRGSRTRKNRGELRAFVASRRVQVVDVVESTSRRYAAILSRCGRRARRFRPTTSGSPPQPWSTA